VLYDGERYRLNPTAFVDSLPDNVHIFRVFSTRPGAFVPLAGMPITPSLMLWTLGSGKPGLPFYRETVQQEWSTAWGLLPEGTQMLDGIGRLLPPDEWLMKVVDDCVRAYLCCLLEILGQTVEANNLDVVREITDVTLDSAKAICACNINRVYHFRKKLSLSDLNGKPVSYKIGYMGKARMKESWERYKTK